jgi:uridine phosphorylase
MEAAMFYAFSNARHRPVLCVAYVTNRPGCVEGDFEKGDYNGARSALSPIRVLCEMVAIERTKGLSGERHATS